MIHPYFLVMSSSSDQFVFTVVDRLIGLGLNVIHIYPGCKINVELYTSDDAEILIMINGTPSPMPTLFWNRAKISTMLGASGPEFFHEHITRNEWFGLFLEFSALCRDIDVNGYANSRLGERRLFQSKVAAECGLRVPQSGIISGKMSATRRATFEESLVGKAIFARNIPAGTANPDEYVTILTFPVSEAEVRCLVSTGLEEYPLFIQRRITAGTEFRVISIGNKSFFYEHKIQVADKIVPDERILLGAMENGVELYGKMFKEPQFFPEVAKKLANFLSNIGFQYGVFDLILDANGHWWFIECNLEGQWCVPSATKTLDEPIDCLAQRFLQMFTTKVQSMCATNKPEEA